MVTGPFTVIGFATISKAANANMINNELMRSIWTLPIKR